MSWNKSATIITIVISVLSLMFTALSFYFNREKTTLLEINRVNDFELTKPLNIENLSSIYMYDSIPVEHLWQSSFVITNKGETTIYGEGFESKNIRGAAIKLHLNNSNSILAMEVVSTNADLSLLCGSLYFSQWKPNEYVEIKVLSDGPLAPELYINDRDIKDAQIVYTQYSPEVDLSKSRLVDYLPRALYQALWWVVVIFDLIIFICLLVAGIQQYREKSSKVEKAATAVVWVIILFLLFAPLLWMF